ncbi:MAG: PspA/IM30 family protein [Burkholderiales bacterium]|jgi:phage shock protein A|nr:PspA/IM30 family protein [Burkholderiales bacterium]MCA3162353.1 PspA/IM30 family protein [Burkholderiales bacterium]MCA3163131.1 PspA/IM30 family protein [Burkholderiales bacterium]MCA3166354.1 PspA/IM30 family protein [Burkholderiales bacterium]MCA3169326.1 PspA/IM30 family protein [Burkholderiales bacterium]
MSETLRQRVSRAIAGGAHALIDKIEDAAPVAILEQSVREVDAIADEVRAELGRTVANRHLAQQQHLNLNKEHEQHSISIEQALGSNRDDLAKPAIARQIDIEAQLPVLESSLAELASQEKELGGFVDALMGKKREMQKAIAEFEKSRQITSLSLSKNGNSSSTIESKLQSAQTAFDRTYQRQTGLDAASQGATLEQAAKLKELGDLVRENKINERLAALKAK